MLEQIRLQSASLIHEFLETTKLQAQALVIVGCSTSEVMERQIGSCSSAEVGKIIFDEIHGILNERGIYLAAQCCEHLNRALILEREAALLRGYEPVNVVPHLKGGGAFATAAYAGFTHPVAVEFIKADAGIDIGDTLIGMHLKPVAVPVRTGIRSIGSAHVVCARTRAKFIGGERARYDAMLQ